jgi:hypothetical protein
VLVYVFVSVLCVRCGKTIINFLFRVWACVRLRACGLPSLTLFVAASAVKSPPTHDCQAHSCADWCQERAFFLCQICSVLFCSVLLCLCAYIFLNIYAFTSLPLLLLTHTHTLSSIHTQHSKGKPHRKHRKS